MNKTIDDYLLETFSWNNEQKELSASVAFWKSIIKRILTEQIGRRDFKKHYSPNEVKPCPFCGTLPELSGNGIVYTIVCGNADCSAHPECSGYSEEDVWASWNNRIT